jgi:ABC-type nitrate/sulfonate/bicarbonate transport system permease component
VPRSIRLLVPAGLLALWQLLGAIGPPDFVLTPAEIARALAAAIAGGELWGHVGASLARSLPGFALGSALGIGLGLVAGVARPLDDLLSPAVFLTYPVPKIVMLPVFMLWFGIGDLSKVLIIALACFYPTFINAYHGARATPTILVWSGRNMGAGRRHLFWKVVVPCALPLTFAGLRVSLALSFILLVSAEMINARSGLGYLVRQAENSLAFDLMYVSIVTIAGLGYAADRLLGAVRRRVLAWQDAATA